MKKWTKINEVASVLAIPIVVATAGMIVATMMVDEATPRIKRGRSKAAEGLRTITTTVLSRPRAAIKAVQEAFLDFGRYRGDPAI